MIACLMWSALGGAAAAPRPGPADATLPGTEPLSWTFGVGMGVGLGPHGRLSALAPSVSPVFEVGGSYLPWPHHGFTLAVVGQYLGDEARAAVTPPMMSGRAGLYGVLVGYAYRFTPLGRWELSLEPAVGVAVVEVGTGSAAVHSDAAPMARARARAQMVLQAPLVLGMALDYSRFAGGHLGAAAAEGGALGVTFLFGGGS